MCGAVDLQEIASPPISHSLFLLYRVTAVSLILSSLSLSLSGRLVSVSGADIEVICSWVISATFCLFLATSPLFSFAFII